MSLDSFKTVEKMLETRRFRVKPKPQKKQNPRKYSTDVLKFLKKWGGSTALQVAWCIQNRKVFTEGEMYTLLDKMVEDGTVYRTKDGLYHKQEGIV